MANISHIFRYIYHKICFMFSIEFLLIFTLKLLNALKIISNLLKNLIIGYIRSDEHTARSCIKISAKLLCLLMLFYSVIEVTKEYFSYPYEYRLSVKPSEGLHLPSISILLRKEMCFLIKQKLINTLISAKNTMNTNFGLKTDQ